MRRHQTRKGNHSAYQGQTAAIRAAAPAAQDMTHRRGSRGHPMSDEERAKNATKSRVRAKGEHPFLVIKRRVLMRYCHA
jgi:IS5 family transposase